MSSQQSILDHLVEYEPNSGCHIFVGSLAGCKESTRARGYGYGQLHRGNKKAMAHRYVYERAVGPIQPGAVIDHICRVRCCVNPAHLRAVTPRDNALKNSLGESAKNAVKTHCPQGHEYSTDNTYLDPANRRHCRTCARVNNRASCARRKAVAA